MAKDDDNTPPPKKPRGLLPALANRLKLPRTVQRRWTKTPIGWANELERTAHMLEQKGGKQGEAVAAANREIAEIIRALFEDNVILTERLKQASGGIRVFKPTDLPKG